MIRDMRDLTRNGGLSCMMTTTLINLTVSKNHPESSGDKSVPILGTGP